MKHTWTQELSSFCLGTFRIAKHRQLIKLFNVNWQPAMQSSWSFISRGYRVHMVLPTPDSGNLSKRTCHEMYMYVSKVNQPEITFLSFSLSVAYTSNIWVAVNHWRNTIILGALEALQTKSSFCKTNQ